MYQDVQSHTGVNGANPHQLVALLFSTWAEVVTRARGALRSGDIVAKCRAVGHAVRIVEEGLRGGLNLEAGGRLAHDLNDLYAYVTARLTYANLHNDDAALAECLGLMRQVQDAWTAIALDPAVRA
ncbi:MAG: flagellar export chaperone FliS [Burkholderiales bacterium]|nr:flagellar export chaperone FliS [Burkholderiales bacterium]MDE1927235.1 flagellar export chaperone FliS [Burkholderiales bacterium]MDE2158991.1 flagellar export chaperone FliS [Burkholderiales bacterium]MDE2501577.1 flagellar export chaperone FliS [Burkholderiales bacterium]